MTARSGVGAEVKRVRRGQGLSQRQLAERAGLSPAYISEVESGAKEPTLGSLRRLAAGLGLPAEALLAASPPSLEAAAAVPEGGPTLGQRLRLVRQARGLTLGEGAGRAGISSSYLADIERGRTSPSVDTLRKLAKALEFSVAALYHSGDVVLASKLRQLRTNLGLSQGDLARRARVSPSLVGQLEQGRVLPSLDTLERLAAALGVSACYLIIEEPRLEDMMAAMNPEVRELLTDPAVQSFLRAVCDLSESEFKFVMRFVQLYKEHRRS